ncbi:MAG: hypothetical protein NTZ13_02945 [Candidatus Parcubacteria bacterium]|nr:hypothetical protein [Candidatus Parcubacteria bacterium]
MFAINEKLRAYVKKDSVTFVEQGKVPVANGYICKGAGTPYPYVALSGFPLMGTLFPDLEPIVESLVFEDTFSTEKELSPGWYEKDHGVTRGLLEKTENGYHMMVESPALKTLMRATDEIRFGHIKPKHATIQ